MMVSHVLSLMAKKYKHMSAEKTELTIFQSDSEGKERIYFGETARNLHVRSQEHYSALKNKC